MPPTSPGLSSFEYWARLQGLWELYLQLIQQPVPTGFTARELGEHAVALQEHSYTVTRAYGELIRVLGAGSAHPAPGRVPEHATSTRAP